MCKKSFAASIPHLHSMLEFIQNSIPFHNIPPTLHHKIILALEEALVNIIDYGYPNQKGTIDIECSHTPLKNGIIIKIEDEGVPFNPASMEVFPIQAHQKDEDYKVGGMGIYLYKNIMDEINYSYINNKNCLILTKFF